VRQRSKASADKNNCEIPVSTFVQFDFFESTALRNRPPAASKHGDPSATIAYVGNPQLSGPGMIGASKWPPDPGEVETPKWSPDPGGVGISKRPPEPGEVEISKRPQDSGTVGTSKWPQDPGADGTIEWPPDPGGVGTSEWAPDLDAVGIFEWDPDPGGYLGRKQPKCSLKRKPIYSR
jgi:hypothetical protein